MMTIFLFSLAGIPPLAGWFAKFVMFRVDPRRRHAARAIVLGVIAAVNSVIAFFYYAGVVREMWFHEPGRATTARRSQVPRRARRPRSASRAAIVVVVGVYPQLFARIGELAVR